MSIEQQSELAKMTEQRQLNLDPQGSNNSNSNSEEKYEREIIYVEKSPFNLTRIKRTDPWRIAIGNTLVSPKTFKKPWMAKVYIKSKPMQLMIAASVIITKMEQQ